MTAQEVKTFANSGQYTQGQYIHFQQSQAFNIVFIPLNYGALGHAGIFDRNQFIKRPRRNYKASDVLGKMARKAPYFINQLNKIGRASCRERVERWECHRSGGETSEGGGGR